MTEDYTHEKIFGKEKYAVVAYYRERKGGEVVIGIYENDEDATTALLSLSEYRNIFNHSIFSGGKVLAVPEKPILKDSLYWKYRSLGDNL
jgi:hypothetical protein